MTLRRRLVAGALAAAFLAITADGYTAMVGWRGDGSGRFPKATPPLKWSTSGNIVWKTELPYYSPSSAIVVGELVFATCNPGLLVCLQKRTGKLLWARPVSPYDALKAGDKAKQSAGAELDGLAAKRDALIAKIAASGSAFGVGGKIAALQKKLDRAVQKAGPEGHPKTGMVYSDGGYMSTTPASDGKLVYAWNGWGVTAAFDMAGKRQWIRFDKLLAQEHGHHGSPVVMGDRVIVYIGKRYLALDSKTGRELWRSENHKPGNFAGYWYGSHVPGVIGGEPVIAAGDGSLIRVSDGVRFLKGYVHQGAPSPIIGGGWVIWSGGVGDVMYCALPKTTQGSADARRKNAGFARNASGYKQSSPLYHDGLIYVIGTKPVLFVHDLAAGKTVYTKTLDFEPPQGRRDRPYGCGISASPAMAGGGGGKIYIWGNFGTTIVIEPGRQYKQLAKNTIETRFDYNYKKKILEGTVGSPYFEGNHIFYRAQKYLYCIGEPGKPFVSADAPKPKPRAVAKRPSARPRPSPRPVRKLSDEQKAKGLLSGAENYIRAGMKPLARKKLAGLIEKYPETAAAAQAKKKLAALGN